MAPFLADHGAGRRIVVGGGVSVGDAARGDLALSSADWSSSSSSPASLPSSCTASSGRVAPDDLADGAHDGRHGSATIREGPSTSNVETNGPTLHP